MDASDDATPVSGDAVAEVETEINPVMHLVAPIAALVVTAGRGLPEAHAQTSGNNDMLVVAGNRGQQQGRDNIFVIDSKSARMAIYSLNQGRFQLLHVRNMLYDMKFEEYSNDKAGVGTQSPSVADVAKRVKEKQ